MATGKVRNRLFLLLNEKERQLGRSITQTELAEELHVTNSIISRWMRNKVERFDAPMIEKLCAYFNCQVGDLLYIEEVEN
jgi:DNA-binding Xre family transcriptional regulator